VARLNRRSALRALAAVLTGVVVTTAGCGGRSGRIDVAALGDELARVVFFVKNAEGFDYDVRAVCTSSGGDGLHFVCHVDATTRGRQANAWDETISCRPTQAADVPRCVSASGYALQ
jgi:hypothetical protein